jgi:hypothetical protein
MVNVEAFHSHGETILDMVDTETGQQINDRCPECGEGISDETLFPLDFFPEVYAEMAEAMIEEV